MGTFPKSHSSSNTRALVIWAPPRCIATYLPALASASRACLPSSLVTLCALYSLTLLNIRLAIHSNGTFIFVTQRGLRATTTRKLEKGLVICWGDGKLRKHGNVGMCVKLAAGLVCTLQSFGCPPAPCTRLPWSRQVVTRSIGFYRWSLGFLCEPQRRHCPFRPLSWCSYPVDLPLLDISHNGTTYYAVFGC